MQDPPRAPVILYVPSLAVRRCMVIHASRALIAPRPSALAPRAKTQFVWPKWHGRIRVASPFDRFTDRFARCQPRPSRPGWIKVDQAQSRSIKPKIFPSARGTVEKVSPTHRPPQPPQTSCGIDANHRKPCQQRKPPHSMVSHVTNGNHRHLAKVGSRYAKGREGPRRTAKGCRAKGLARYFCEAMRSSERSSLR
jgi:hypothetical protein